MTTDTFKIAALVSALAIGAIALTGTMVEARERGDGPRGMDFSTMDVDGSGEITQEDLDALRENRFAEIDTNGDGSVSRDEFMAASAARAGDRAGDMFDRLDADGDGSLSRDALEARGGGRGPGAGRLLERADTDNSGGVSEEELAAAMERFAERGGKRGGGKRQ